MQVKSTFPDRKLNYDLTNNSFPRGAVTKQTICVGRYHERDLGQEGKIRFKMYFTRLEDVDCVYLAHGRIKRRTRF
jgi:hypothetical protein